MRVKNNCFGLGPVAAISLPNPIPQGQTGSILVPFAANPAQVAAEPPTPVLQAALKNLATEHVSYFNIPLPLWVVCTDRGQVSNLINNAVIFFFGVGGDRV